MVVPGRFVSYLVLPHIVPHPDGFMFIWSRYLHQVISSLVREHQMHGVHTAGLSDPCVVLHVIWEFGVSSVLAMGGMRRCY